MQTPSESTLLSLLLSMAADESDVIAAHAIDQSEVVARATVERRQRQLNAVAAADGWFFTGIQAGSTPSIRCSWVGMN